MSHLSVDSIISADAYNDLLMDHEASERAALVGLKHNFLPALSAILKAHGVADLVELHLLHRHFSLSEGEALVHKTVAISGSPQLPDINVDIAKVVPCPESLKSALIPILWMASPKDGLVAYEYSLSGSVNLLESAESKVPSEVWNSFGKAFAAHVYQKGIADVVSLKSKRCLNGGEYVAPDQRVLFRVPMSVVHLQPGTGLVESGWALHEAATEPDPAPAPAPDTHLTHTRVTKGGTIGHWHEVKKAGSSAFNPKEISVVYTDAMWATAESEGFGATNKEVGVEA